MAQTTSQDDWIVWGSHPLYANGTPIKLTRGKLAHCRKEVEFRKQDKRWSLVIRKPGMPHKLDNNGLITD